MSSRDIIIFWFSFFLPGLFVVGGGVVAPKWMVRINFMCSFVCVFVCLLIFLSVWLFTDLFALFIYF